MGFRQLRTDLNELKHLNEDVLTRTNANIASRPSELTYFVITKISALIKLYRKRSLIKDIQLVYASVRLVRDLFRKFKNLENQPFYFESESLDSALKHIAEHEKIKSNPIAKDLIHQLIEEVN